MDIDREVNDAKLADFFMAELADLTNKMDSSDQSIQFFVQLYITIITATIALLAKELIYDKQYILCSLLWLALSIMGYFVLRYTIAGREIQYEYLDRSNRIRKRLLSILGYTRDEIRKYGYTSPLTPKKDGMKSWRIRFLETCVSSFSGAAAFFLLLHYDVIHVTEHVFLVSVAVIFVVRYWLKKNVSVTIRRKKVRQ